MKSSAASNTVPASEPALRYTSSVGAPLAFRIPAGEVAFEVLSPKVQALRTLYLQGKLEVDAHAVARAMLRKLVSADLET